MYIASTAYRTRNSLQNERTQRYGESKKKSNKKKRPYRAFCSSRMCSIWTYLLTNYSLIYFVSSVVSTYIRKMTLTEKLLCVHRSTHEFEIGNENRFASHILEMLVWMCMCAYRLLYLYGVDAREYEIKYFVNLLNLFSFIMLYFCIGCFHKHFRALQTMLDFHKWNYISYEQNMVIFW